MLLFPMAVFPAPAFPLHLPAISSFVLRDRCFLLYHQLTFQKLILVLSGSKPGDAFEGAVEIRQVVEPCFITNLGYLHRPFYEKFTGETNPQFVEVY